MPYRCSACGNRTRFDVVATRRTRAFHHYSLGGELTVEEEEVLEERVEEVSCRWCGAAGSAIEEIEDVAPAGGEPVANTAEGGS
ncbi:MAG: hypothetical protein M5U14_08835 [Acidimicrobiia bacterium]|nr:hypothetical protein [Acidimicrobiia bacterium]